MLKYDWDLSDLKILVLLLYYKFNLLYINKCQFLKVIVSYQFNRLKQ